MLTIEQFLYAMPKTTNGTIPLSNDQRKTLDHDYHTPLWIIAGPGTGKTHTLSWLVLKRLLVDNIPITKMIVTTFTRKAAAELETRLIQQRQQLINNGLVEASDIDLSQLKVGTLHGLCSVILQEQRYLPALRIRVLEDDLAQQFFVRRTHNRLGDNDDLTLWETFGMADNNSQYTPNKAKKVENACKIFNRITENQIYAQELIDSGDPHFEEIGQAYLQYEKELKDQHRTDQAHLQRHLLDFLNSPEGTDWLGEGFTVLVDEYQDTNPIQEELYFKLVGSKGDLTVVGDDDQSLYRFRGATVESLIDFDVACEHYLNRTPTPVYLNENRRSHPAIVEWVNRFIGFHPDMQETTIRVRAPHKPALSVASKIKGNYPAVMGIVEDGAPRAARKMVETIRGLKDEKLIKDYSQIAILTFSTRETNQAIGTYTRELDRANIPFSNPRNKTAQKDNMIKAILGALSMIMDSKADPLPWHLPGSVLRYIEEARAALNELIDTGTFPALKKYIDDSIDAVNRSVYDTSSQYNYLVLKGGRRVSIASLFYKLIAYEPFSEQLHDPTVGGRLKALTSILAEYESLYNDGELRLEEDPSGGCRINKGDIYTFYSVFIEGIHDGLNDPEDEDVSIHLGMVNVMTIHQSKGLEFDVVFVLRPDKKPFESDTHVLEDVLEQFIHRHVAMHRRTSTLRAAEDAVRLFFVAYSRAERLLILTGANIENWQRALGSDAKGRPIHDRRSLTDMGVYLI